MSDNLIGATTAIFVVSLSKIVDEIVDVSWTTRDGTAKAGTDYQAASGVVSFLPGETTKQIQVIVYGQNVSPLDEKNFFINLSPPTNAVLGTALIEAVIKVEDEAGVPVTSVIVAQGKRGLKGDPGLSAYEQAVLMGYEGTVEQWMQEQADAAAAADRASDYASDAASAAARAESAATSASFLGNIFPNPEAGVDPVTGVSNGAYYNVRSPDDDSFLDEYQNLGGVPTPTGKSYPSSAALEEQKEYIDALTRKKQPSFYGAVGDGVTVDNAAFSALVAAKPGVIEADPKATYLLDSSSTITVDDNCLFNGNGCTIIMDQRWNFQKTPMWGSQLSEAAVKGQTVLKMAFMTNIAVGAEILVFQNLGLSGAAIDPYFLSVSNDVDNGEYSSHINYVTAVDAVNKTITLAIPLRFNAPIQTAVYVTDRKKLTFVNTNVVLRGDANGFRLIDNCSNIDFIGGSLIQPSNEDNNVVLRVNTCKDVMFAGVKQKGVNISIEYGSYNCGVRGGQGSSYGNGDAMVMIWCAATRCFSEMNNFTPSEKMRDGSITAGVYLGAKTRDCWSTDDCVDGLPYGFRAQWGAINPTFNKPVAKNIKTYSFFADYSHNVQVFGGKLYDKALRTVGVHSLTLKDTLLDSGWRGEAGEVPIMLDLNRGNETDMVREDYTISGNTVIGAARSWLALSKSTFSNNNMTSLRFVNAGVMKDTYFNGGSLGSFYAQNMINCGFTNITVDHAILGAGTIAGSEVAAVHFYGQTVVHLAGNTIKHPTCGVKRTSPSNQVNCITDGGGNNIIALTQWDTGVDDTTAPAVSAGAAYLSRGLEYKSNVAGSKVVWRYSGSAWVKGFTSNPQLTYAQGSFPNTPNGLTTFSNTRTIAGAVVGDTVVVSTTSTDIGEVKGKYFARVTAPDTITVYYQDKSGISETVAAVNVTLTVVK